jgi:hypothetical protein
MASLLKKALLNLKYDREELKRKTEALRDPVNRAALATLNRLAKGRCFSVSTYGSSPYVCIDADNLDSFKSGELPKFLSRCMDAGIEFTGTEDWPESGNRDFKGRIGNVRVCISARLGESSKACHVKVVGEVTTTRPKYAIVCD